MLSTTSCPSPRGSLCWRIRHAAAGRHCRGRSGRRAGRLDLEDIKTGCGDDAVLQRAATSASSSTRLPRATLISTPARPKSREHLGIDEMFRAITAGATMMRISTAAADPVPLRNRDRRHPPACCGHDRKRVDRRPRSPCNGLADTPKSDDANRAAAQRSPAGKSFSSMRPERRKLSACGMRRIVASRRPSVRSATSSVSTSACWSR